MAGLQSRTRELEPCSSTEDEPLGTGGAVRYAADPGRGTVVIFNGDIISDLDLGAVLRHHREKKAGVTIVLKEVDDPTNYGLVETDADGRVRQFLEKPGYDEVAGRNINAGAYVIEPEYLELMKEGVYLSIEREFFPLLVERGEPFFSYVHHGYWADIGNVSNYLKAHEDFFQRRGALSEEYREVRPMLWAARDVNIPGDIQVRGPAVVGGGTSIGEGVVLDRFCVIGPGCRVGDGVHLSGCVLWEGVSVGPETRLRSSVLGDGSRLGRNIRLSGLFALGSEGYIPDYSHHTELHDEFDPK